MSRQLSLLAQLARAETIADRFVRMQRYEQQAYRAGARAIAGVDEAGRGCLAGPVVAAAVILPRTWGIAEVNDSKQLTPAQRDELFVAIVEQAVSFGVGVIAADVIDRVNILQATYLAMAQAIAELSPTPDLLLLDAVALKNVPLPQRSIIKGDTLSISIAAASIIAKVTRDRLMGAYDREFPAYGFAAHKGYGTQQHRAAIAAHGPCPIHRVSFRGVKEYVKLSNRANASNRLF